MTLRLPVVLDNIRIATPCNADWDEMAGDERVRFCGRCDKNVYNLSSMTRAEAEALVAEKEGRLCVRLYQRADGTVLSADCPVGVRKKQLRHRVWASLSKVAASAALLLGVAGGRARADLCVRDGKAGNQQPMRMGKIAVQPSEAKPPKKPTPKMGEPMPMIGDVAIDPAPVMRHRARQEIESPSRQAGAAGPHTPCCEPSSHVSGSSVSSGWAADE